MIRLTDEEIDNLRVDYQDKHLGFDDYLGAIAKAQLKKALKSVGKESKRMDGTIYLVPDYVEYRKALKEVGLE